MLNNEILQYIVDDKKYYNAIKNITKNDELTDDLYNYMLLVINDTNNEKLNKLINDKALIYFWTRVGINQFKSTSSKFYYDHKKKINDKDENYNLSTSEGIEKLDKIQKTSTEIHLDEFYEYMMDRIKSELFWYDAELFQLYRILGSLNKVYRKTRIPYKHVRESHLRVKKWIAENLKEEWKQALNGNFTYQNHK